MQLLAEVLLCCIFILQGPLMLHAFIATRYQVHHPVLLRDNSGRTTDTSEQLSTEQSGRDPVGEGPPTHLSLRS